MAEIENLISVIWRKGGKDQANVKSLISNPLTWAFDLVKTANEANDSRERDTALEILEYVIKEYSPES